MFESDAVWFANLSPMTRFGLHMFESDVVWFANLSPMTRFGLHMFESDVVWFAKCFTMTCFGLQTAFQRRGLFCQPLQSDVVSGNHITNLRFLENDCFNWESQVSIPGPKFKIEKNSKND